MDMNDQQMTKLKIALTSNNYKAQSHSSQKLTNRISTDNERQEELKTIETLTARMVEDSSRTRIQYMAYEGLSPATITSPLKS